MTRDTLEAFTHCKFIKKEQWDGVPDAHIEKTAQGLMEAKWYTGTLYVVPTKAFNKKTTSVLLFIDFRKRKFGKPRTHYAKTELKTNN